MKHLAILICLLFSTFTVAQVEVGLTRLGKAAPLKPEALEKFKNTTTLFVLPDWIDEDVYEKIIEEVWTVTPYKIMAFEDYEIQELYEENYSFLTIDFQKKVRKNTTGNTVNAFYSFIDLSIYDGPEITARRNKFDKRVIDKKMPMILKSNRTTLGRCYLFPSEEFIKVAVKGDRLGVLEGLYAQNIYYNYSAGLLKNYLQKLHKHVSQGSMYTLKKKDHHASKISELITAPLYLPEYTMLKTNIVKGKVTPMKEKEIKNLLESYKYNYETISDAALSEAILNKKDINYLRFVRIDDQTFIQVVNALTGDVIFRDYHLGVIYNLKPKNFEYLSDVISQTDR